MLTVSPTAGYAFFAIRFSPHLLLVAVPFRDLVVVKDSREIRADASAVAPENCG